MLNKNSIEELMAQAETWEGPVLSTYLTVDPSLESNLNQAFVARFRIAVQRLESRLANNADELKLMKSTAAKVQRKLEKYRPSAKSLVIVCDGASGEQWTRELQVRLPEIVEWSESPYVLHMLEALDEHERFAVALVDRGRARVFVVHAGEADEVSDLSAADVSHRKTTGTDYRWSDANFQRRVDEHATQHARNTVDALLSITDRLCIDRLLLAGSIDARKEMEQLLPKRLRRKLAGSIPLPVTSTTPQVIRVVEEIGAQAEREEESQLVTTLVDATGERNRAVTGLPSTVEALHESQVARLVISGDYHPTWGELPELNTWLRSDAPDRPDDLKERLVEKTLESGGRVEFVWGEAANRLKEEAGGIGAFLRY